MRYINSLLSLFLLTICTFSASAQNPNGPNEKEIADLVTKEADNLMKLFNLDDYQLFFVDSVLQANMPPMMAEMDRVKKSGAAVQSSYQVVADEWLDKTDKAFEKIFTKEQWAKYMKSAYGKEKKKRDKRMKERAAATEAAFK